MKFFKPEDFKYDSITLENSHFIRMDYAANRANEKLEREGKVVYCEFPRDSESTLDLLKFSDATHKALLINIEPIEKCKHPVDKIRCCQGTKVPFYTCECGAKVQPKEFEEV